VQSKDRARDSGSTADYGKIGSKKIIAMAYIDPEEGRKHRLEYLQRPEVKAHRKQWNQEYNQRPEVKARLRSPKVKAERSVRQSMYVRRPEIKAKLAQRNLERLRKTYGWSPEAFKEALDKQGNSCAICLETFKETPHADHAHCLPPIPRGLLCASCNAGLGFFRERPEVLLRAVDYIKLWDKGRLGLPKETK
jgi:hypothetical protein